MKKFKKLLAILLVASMIFTTNAVNVFAEGMNANQEEQLNEETVETSEETTVGTELGEAEEEAEETTVGAKLGEPEEDIDENLSEPEDETRRGERLSEPEDDTRRGERLSEPALEEEEAEEEAEETTVEAKFGEPEEEAEAEEEAEETTIEAKLGEPEEEPTEAEIELELDKKKKDDQLYGDDPATPFAYWIVTGDGDDKTIHYYASATDGDGRTAVSIGPGGIEYTGLENSEREKIKKAVIEEPIVATDVRNLFYFFKGLVSITDLRKLDTTSVTSFEGMFDSCYAIVELDVSGLETDSLTDTSVMFSECSSLTKLTFGNYFDTGKVRRMVGMFEDCIEIRELDLTSFNTSNVTDMNYMFSGCENLRKIYVSDYFTVGNVESSDDMFTDSLLLEGGSGTRCDDVSEPYDSRYAHIDEGPTNPGFFSGAPTPTTYTVTYNQNLPSGYSLSDGKTWYSVATTSDLSGNPIELEGSADMTCEDASGNVRTLEGWNTVAELTGDKYNFGEKFSDASVFTSNPLTLYAIWSDPVAPGPAGSYMYWIVDGNGDDKTIHYYASATDGDGRTAVDFDENGVVYTSLSEGERNSIKKAEFEEPIVATDVRRLFYYFIGLVSITDIENLDTSNATSFKSMFEHCEAIGKIEISGLETNSLTDTSNMFAYCTSATSITFSDNFDTSNVTSMREMFNTTGAVELDLTNFDTSNVTDMYGMFSSCENLETIRVSDKFVVDKVSTSNGKFMFSNCDKLVGEKGTKIADLSSPYGVAYAHIDEGPSNPGLFSGAPTPTIYTVTYNQNLPSGYTLSDGKTWYSVATTSDLSGDPIELEGSSDMTCEDTSGNVRTLEGWNTAAGGAGTPHAFGETINDDTEFTGDTLDLYAIWSDPVAPGPVGSYIYWIVDGEGDNKTIHYYNTDGTDRTKLEIGADGVVYKNLTKDDIKKAVIEDKIVAADARGFFQAFYNIESIDNLTNLDTSNATSFAGMFSLCYKLDDIKLSSFNTKKVTDTSRMFSSCSSLTSLTFGDNFDTSKVTNMAGMFDSCNSLTSITFGSNFKTNNVTNMSDMFCAVGLEKLDLTSFDTSKVTDMRNMFVQSQIKTIYVSDDFIVDQVANSEYMFYDCKNLVGGKGTKYDDVSDPWDNTYAHIDEGSTNPGLFTAAPTPTPPTPSPSPSYSGGTTGGSDSDGSSSGGPINVTNNNLNNFSINNIPQSLLLNDPALYLQLMSYPENTYMQKTNAKDIYGNTGYGRWMRIPNTTTWYFYAGDFNNNTNNSGFLKDGWFNLGWDGVDRWYRFDSNGVMQLGWYEENGKIYFLQNDLNDNWYGKAVTGTHVIDGKTYNFDATGALIG